MNKSTLKTLFILGAIILLSLFLLTPDALARAGGGGGRGRASIIALPFILIYMAIFGYFLKKKSRQSRELLEKLKIRDRSWDPDAIRDRVTEVFFKVQHAWMERNQNLAKDYMSEHLYKKHKMQTDQMIVSHQKNILSGMALKDIQVVEVKDYIGDNMDRMWVYINGSAADFTVDDKTNQIISGDDTKNEDFQELWKFVKGPTGWVLDEIDPEAEIKDLVKMHSLSQELASK